MPYYVYHIVRKEDQYDADCGYIGVTNNLSRRQEQHFSALRSSSHTNYKLQEYYDAKPSSVVMYVFKEFPNGEEDNAYKLESFLRPIPNVGLNIAVGGNKDYHERFAKKGYSNEHRPKGLWNRVKSLFMALDHNLADFADESLAKSEARQKQSKQRIDQWQKEQQDKLDKEIKAHNQRVKLSQVERDAVEAWKNTNKEQNSPSNKVAVNANKESIDTQTQMFGISLPQSIQKLSDKTTNDTDKKQLTSTEIKNLWK